jgi:hypothetical protein
MRSIRKRIEEKKQGLYTDDEIREIASHRLDAVLDAHDFNSDFITDFRSSRRAGTSSSEPTRSTAAAAGASGEPSRRFGGCCGPSRSSSGTPTR